MPCTGAVACLPEGACCLEDEVCVVTTEAGCLDLGGLYLGDGTDCGLTFYNMEDCDNPFEDISGTGIELFLPDDGGEVVPIGFTFNFYGDDHVEIGVASNGYLTFGTDLSDLSDDPIPNHNDPNDLIAMLWDDLDPGNTGSPATIHYQTIGDRFIVQFTDVPEYPNEGANTFQAVLYEGSNCIELRYLAITTDDFVAGIENQDGTDGIDVTALVAPGVCISFCPETTGNPCEGLEIPRTLIIMQGACPAPVNAKSNGLTPMALVGDMDFDVSLVDLDSIELRRCDGLGGVAYPFASQTRIKDLNHPNLDDVGCGEDQVGCACNEDQESDGIDDLSMKFKTAAMTAALELDTVMQGEVISLVLTGVSTDGTAFEAVDCIRVVNSSIGALSSPGIAGGAPGSGSQ